MTERSINQRDINVLLIGHARAGKSSTLRRIIELRIAQSQRVDAKNEKVIEKVKHREGTIVEFGKCVYETEKCRYHFLEVQSHYHYVPNMMNRMMKAHIAVLFVSGRQDDLDSETKDQQLRENVYLMMTLGIKKILLVINKVDQSCTKQRYEELQAKATTLLNEFNFEVQNDLKVLPMSSEPAANFQTSMDKTVCSWWNGQCFMEALDSFNLNDCPDARVQLIPLEKPEANYFEQLANVDFHLDKDPHNCAAAWYARCVILGNQEYYDACFEAAKKAGEFGYHSPASEKKAFYLLSRGYYHEARKDFDAATEVFQQARKALSMLGHSRALPKLQIVVDEISAKKPTPKAAEYSKTSIATKKLEVETAELQKIPEVLESKQKQQKSEGKNFKAQSTSKSRKKSKGGPNTSKETKQLEGFSKAPEKLDVETEAQVAQKEQLPPKNTSILVAKEVIVKVTNELKYEVNICEDGGDLYSGLKILKRGITLPQSFIACSEEHMRNYASLVSLGLNETKVITIGDLIDVPIDGMDTPFFAVEPIQMLEKFFSEELLTWRRQIQLQEADKESMVNAWWHFIEVKFKKVFRDVIDTFLYLYLHNCACGDVFDIKNVIYITKAGNVRLLPSMKSNVTYADDIAALGKLMRGILNLPCAGQKLIMNSLPDEISHLLLFYTRKMNHVPYLLIDHVFFWTPLERVDFIFNLRRLTEKDWIFSFYEYLDDEMTQDDRTYFWVNDIPSGIFRELWSKGDRNLAQPKVYPYLQNQDILRYLVSVYRHYNDAKYASYRSKELDVIEIEMEIRKVFPRIYSQLMDALYEFANSRMLKFEEIEHGFRKLSRHRNMFLE